MTGSRRDARDATPIPAGGRIPPHNVEAEEAVLGGILLDNRQIDTALEIAKPDDFYRAATAAIYRGMVSVNDRREPIDLVTLSGELRAQGTFEQSGGIENLSRLSSMTPSASNVAHYARVVKDMALRRRAISAASDIIGDAYKLDTGMERFLEGAEQKILGVSDEKISSSYSKISDIVVESWQMLEERIDRKESITGTASGFARLDDITAGFQPSNLVILAARPSIGKTALALNFAQHVGMNLKRPVLIFSLEMSKSELVMRMLCSEARVDASRVRTGHLGDSDFPRLVMAAGKLSESEIWIDDTPALAIGDMRAKARRLHHQNPLALIVVDYLQLMRSPDKSDFREQEVSDISRSLKAIAKELNVPVIALSQLNRSLEARPNKRPILSDLRESGSIEQDADMIMFIYRDEFYDANTADKGIAELLLSKHRNGPTGMVKLAFCGEHTRFDTLEEHVPEIVRPEEAAAPAPADFGSDPF